MWVSPLHRLGTRTEQSGRGGGSLSAQALLSPASRLPQGERLFLLSLLLGRCFTTAWECGVSPQWKPTKPRAKRHFPSLKLPCLLFCHSDVKGLVQKRAGPGEESWKADPMSTEQRNTNSQTQERDGDLAACGQAKPRHEFMGLTVVFTLLCVLVVIQYFQKKRGI